MLSGMNRQHRRARKAMERRTGVPEERIVVLPKPEPDLTRTEHVKGGGSTNGVRYASARS
jgi:hypothetical protein